MSDGDAGGEIGGDRYITPQGGGSCPVYTRSP